MLSPALSLAATAFVLISVPGPSNLYIIGQTLASGRRAAFLSILGNTAGMATVGAAVVFLLGELLQRNDWLQTVLVVVGALVIVVLAVMYLRESRREWSGSTEGDVTATDTDTLTVTTDSRRALVSGFIVGVTNPKGPIIFGTIVPGFLPAGADPYPGLVLLALIPLTIGPVVDTVWVLCASAARGWIMQAPRGLAVIKAVGAVMLLLMAGYMLLVEA